MSDDEEILIKCENWVYEMMYMWETGLVSMIKFITFHLLSYTMIFSSLFSRSEKLCRLIGMKWNFHCGKRTRSECHGDPTIFSFFITTMHILTFLHRIKRVWAYFHTAAVVAILLRHFNLHFYFTRLIIAQWRHKSNGNKVLCCVFFLSLHYSIKNRS